MSSIKTQLNRNEIKDKIIIMELLSSKYGWTPKEIREQSYEDIINYLDISEVKNKIYGSKRTKNFNDSKR